ncbi:MAG: hypothetical protein ACR2RF_32270 [Geminicoccaceae bacterium]
MIKIFEDHWLWDRNSEGRLAETEAELIHHGWWLAQFEEDCRSAWEGARVFIDNHPEARQLWGSFSHG